MSVRLIQMVLAIQPEVHEIDEEDMLPPELITSICVGLVTVDNRTNAVHLSHETVKTFLSDNIHQWFLAFHDYLATTCLTAIVSDLWSFHL